MRDMPGPVTSHAEIVVADNLVHLICPFAFSTDDTSGIVAMLTDENGPFTLGRVLSRFGLNADAFGQRVDRHRDNPVFELRKHAPNRGLHPQIEDALYGSRTPDGTVPAGLCFKMTGAIRTCLNEEATPLFRLFIPKTDIFIGLSLKELHVHLLGSGRGFFVPALTAQTENISLLATAIDQLTRQSGMAKECFTLRGQDQKQKMGDVLNALFFEPLGGDWVARASEVGRRHIAVGVRYATPPRTEQEKRFWAYVLSCGISPDQQEPSDSEIKQRFLHPRKGRYSAVGMEGTVCFIETPENHRPGFDFAKGFLSDHFKDVLLPLILWSLHEYEYLLAIARRARIPIAGKGPDAATLDRLNDFEAELLSFRLNWRFHHVSRVSLQEAFYSAHREALGLDVLMNEVSTDVNEAMRYLDHHAARQNAARHKAIAYRQSAWGIAFGGLVLLAGLAGMNFAELTEPPLQLWPDMGWKEYAQTPQFRKTLFVYATIFVTFSAVARQFIRFNRLADREMREVKETETL